MDNCVRIPHRVMQGEAGGGASAIRRYVYDSQGRMIGEYGTGAADVRAEYIYLHPDAANDNDSPHGGDDGMGGYALLAVMAPDASAGNAVTAQYVHTNHLGAPLFMTNESGAVTTPGAYAQPVFPGQIRTRADLYHNRYRDYDPTTGRYIQADPIGLEGGNNPYLYANGNPMRYVDPDGLWAVPAARAAYYGGYALGAAGYYLWYNYWCAERWKQLWGNGPGGGSPPSAPPTGGRSGDDIPGPGFDDGFNPLPPFYGLPPQAPPFYNKPPSDARDPDGAKAPGHPGDHPDFVPPKAGQPEWGKAPRGPQKGWNAGDGSVWVPTGHGGTAHGGPHWDQQFPDGGYRNRLPPK